MFGIEMYLPRGDGETMFGKMKMTDELWLELGFKKKKFDKTTQWEHLLYPEVHFEVEKNGTVLTEFGSDAAPITLREVMGHIAIEINRKTVKMIREPMQEAFKAMGLSFAR